MMQTIKIGGKTIGDKIFIIAEMACAHGGKLNYAKKIIDAAARSNADAIQFEIYEPDLTCIPGTGEHKELRQVYFSKEQWLTLKNLLNDLIEQFPGVVIKGHNEVSSKACPSFDVQAWLLKEGIIKTKQVTTPEEKQYLEEKREQFRGEQLELFGGRKDK